MVAETLTSFMPRVPGWPEVHLKYVHFAHPSGSLVRFLPPTIQNEFSKTKYVPFAYSIY